ncbi:MaoC/PaaZ C-terminal domain-containing protein [Brevundimonas sp.]|uniref:MaoC family dehydratase n=1 Tax=Brevundimonas sp. TaxID=1871086 RepID=UPI00289ADA20|nr:MaoC/PaaZ C-terminal domain-containing protein [Brevundimonas sp.]
MALDPKKLFATPIHEVRQVYGAKDVILYALSIGAGAEPGLDELSFVYEGQLQTLPSMAVVLGYPGFWQGEAEYGIDWRRVLHGEQSVEIHAPLASAGVVQTRSALDILIDKGADKGALLYWTRRLYDEATGSLLATVRQSSFLRGDGGCGDWGDGPALSMSPLPDRAPDDSLTLRTRTDQALLYRLNGDMNPLHADPAIARSAGFDGPILHGLCTYGFAARGLIHLACQGRADRLRRLDVRFSSVVTPGETLRIDVWHEAASVARFRCVALDRDVVVLNNGYAEIVAP